MENLSPRDALPPDAIPESGEAPAKAQSAGISELAIIDAKQADLTGLPDSLEDSFAIFATNRPRAVSRNDWLVVMGGWAKFNAAAAKTETILREKIARLEAGAEIARLEGGTEERERLEPVLQICIIVGVSFFAVGIERMAHDMLGLGLAMSIGGVVVFAGGLWAKFGKRNKK